MRNRNIKYYQYYRFYDSSQRSTLSKGIMAFRSLLLLNFGFLALLFVVFHFSSIKSTLSPITEVISPINTATSESRQEVFGFAPYWTFHKLDNVDFDVLTTFAYFGVDARVDGSLDREGRGYEVFMSDEATQMFEKAHRHDTRVVLTITQMDNASIKSILDDPSAQKQIIRETVEMVDGRGIDGVNVDFEYTGDPGSSYRGKFSKFVQSITDAMHKKNPDSYVTVSVYASAAKDPKMYDIKALSDGSDGIFMMAYDFATAGSDTVMPTAPLYGHSEGKYWYDISTAVDDFLKQMPSEKLILGLPWYGYNYPVSSPENEVRHPGYYSYYWRWGYRYSQYVYPPASAQTHENTQLAAVNSQKGWDDAGQVGWVAYQDTSGMWRKIFQEDSRSQGIKYDFALEKNLGGVGMWALGFDKGGEFWELLAQKFGPRFADRRGDGRI